MNLSDYSPYTPKNPLYIPRGVSETKVLSTIGLLAVEVKNFELLCPRHQKAKANSGKDDLSSKDRSSQ